MTDTRKLTCLIIEDEPIAAEVLEDYIAQVSFLELKGICKDAIYALDRLKQERTDVIFLDIHLPKLKGLDLLKVLKQKPQTILTTAYHQYALDAFEHEVVDYLMKPIEFSRFLQAVNKLKWPEAAAKLPPEKEAPAYRPFRFFNVNKKMVRVFYDEILYVESLKDYSRIHLQASSIVVRGQIGEFEDLLREYGFLRLHRSYLAPKDKIDAYSASEVEIGARRLPIGRSYRDVVAKALEGYLHQ